MLTDVPIFLTQGALVSLLEDLTPCMRGAFDFFYCPWNPVEKKNLSYCIINFCNALAAMDFQRRWDCQPLLAGGSRRLKIFPAALQGRAQNLRHFSGFALAQHADPRFRPLVRSDMEEALRPMSLTPEIPASQQ